MTDSLEGQMTIFDAYDQNSLFGKTCPVPFHRQDSMAEKTTREKTSKPFSRKSSESSSQTLPTFLYLQKGSGPKLDASWDTERTDALFPSPGEYMTRSFGECPSEESASHLSLILEESAPPKYYLSAAACAGIIRRSEKRGKQLPEILETALRAQAGLGH